MDSKVISIQHKQLSECRERLHRLLGLSEAIREAAQEGDWELALARQQFRTTQLKGFYAESESLPQEVAELIASGIRQILAIDAEVTDLACRGKTTLQEEAALKQRQGQALKNYLQP